MLYTANMKMVDKSNFFDEHKLITISMRDTFIHNGNILISTKKYETGIAKIWKHNNKKLKTKFPKDLQETILREHQVMEFHKYLCDIFLCKAINIRLCSSANVDDEPCYIIEKVL